MLLKNILCAISISAVAAASTPAIAAEWTVDQDKSKLGFEVKQGDGTLTGFFGSWAAAIDFDPEAPETAKISATIDPASASTGNPQFDATLPGSDWFDADGFPRAEFKSEALKRVEGNSYRAEGTLTIKGISQPVDLDFTLEIEGDTAAAKGTARIKRLDYQLGAGVGDETVGDTVTVTLDLTATR